MCVGMVLTNQLKKMKKYLFLFLLLSTVLFSCAKGPYSVKYTASGSSGILNVSYIDENGNNQSYTGNSPWNYSFTAKSGMYLKVSASCDAGGTSEVHIFINNVDKVHDTETGFTAEADTHAE